MKKKRNPNDAVVSNVKRLRDQVKNLTKTVKEVNRKVLKIEKLLY